ncbi:tripartite tricarboxylate transporter substrate binding protein [soil metagenome]
MTFIRSIRRLAIAACATAVLAPCLAAQATWPDRPIKLIVPFAPGGSNDNIARLIAVKLGERLGQPIVVDNRGGAGGTIGTDVVVRSPADGYTLLFASSSITTNASIGKKLSYDPIKDLAPIGEIGAGPFVIVVANEVKAKSLRELIDLARAKPRSIGYGSAGIGGLNHLGTELFASEAKVELLHVPYKGISLAFTDLMAGNLQMLLPSLASAVPQIRAGAMRALAVTSAQRSPLAPDIPTTAEAGLPGFQLDVWWGLVGPARLPAPVVKRLNDELNAVLRLPDVNTLLAREAATAKPGSPEAFGTLVRDDFARWTQLTKNLHIETE